MIFLKVYLVGCLLWSIFALYKHRTTYPAPFNNYRSGMITMMMNFIICPYAIYIAISKNKI